MERNQKEWKKQRIIEKSEKKQGSKRRIKKSKLVRNGN